MYQALQQQRCEAEKATEKKQNAYHTHTAAAAAEGDTETQAECEEANAEKIKRTHDSNP